jgi:chemotaxis protein CheD
MVRIGEVAASADPSDVLVALGLGSCMGVAVIDRAHNVAGLAHVMLPESPRGSEDSLRCADRAIPALLERVLGLGARRNRLEVAMVGGAQMFAARDSVGVGARNDVATRAALKLARLAPDAAVTGGAKGRTVRVEVGGEVSYREAGGTLIRLLPKGATA